MILQGLKVENFKSVRRADLEFGRVNLFIGGNGSGKSNLLECIGVIAASLSRGITDGDLQNKGVRRTPPALMKSAFKDLALPRTLKLGARIEGGIEYDVGLGSSVNENFMHFYSEKLMHNGTSLLGRSMNGAKIDGVSVSKGRTIDRYRSLWDQRGTSKMPPAVEKALAAVARYAIYAPQTEFLRGSVPASSDMTPIGLCGEGLERAVATILKDPHTSLKKKALDLVWLPGWTHEVGVKQLEPFLRPSALASQSGQSVYFLDNYMRDDRRTLSVYDSSEGTLFLLFVAILLAHKEAPPIFALDNVDNSLNPKLTRAMLETIIEITEMTAQKGYKGHGARQVFMTSHNPTALDAFDLFNDEERVFVVKRDNKGHTVVKRLEPKKGMTREDWNRMVGNRNLSQRWIEGQIDGALGADL